MTEFPRVSIVALVVTILIGCQSVPGDYEVLADKAVDGHVVSTAKLRESFLALDDLAARIERLSELELQALQLVEDEPLKLGSIGAAILDTYYGSLTGHFVLQRFYEYVESPDAALLHQQWVVRIREGMEATGDGTREQPFLAMTAAEGSIYVKSLGMSPVGSIYQTGEELPYTLLLQARPDEGRIHNFHFDLTSVYEAAHQQFAAEEEFSPFALIGYQAKRGDTAAQAAIGAFLATQGRGSEAVDWLRAASRTGNLLANSILARIFWERASQETNPDLRQQALDEVLENYLHAVALGSADAMYALGILYLNDHYGEDNKTSGIPLLMQAADMGHGEAAMFLAHMHYTGEAVEKDLDTAGRYYVMASEANNPFARRSYARFLLAEKRADPRAVGWLEELAADDDAEAMILLGNLHARGVGVKPSPRRAVSWYKDAVKQSPDDANIVNEVAWTLTVTDIDGLRRERYALTIMERMMTTDDQARAKPEFLDTWAAAHAANGDFDRAVDLQQQAVAAAQAEEYENVREIIEQHLDTFRNGQTITEPAP